MDGEVKRDHGLGVWINAEHKRRCGSRRILSKDLELCFLLVIFLPVLGHTNLRNGLYLEKSATHKANVVVEIKRIVLIMDSINTGNETNNASWSVTWPLVFWIPPEQQFNEQVYCYSTRASGHLGTCWTILTLILHYTVKSCNFLHGNLYTTQGANKSFSFRLLGFMKMNEIRIIYRFII